MSKEIKREINFKDGKRNILFFVEFDSLKRFYGFGFKGIFKDFFFDNGDKVLFTIPLDELDTFFKRNYGDYDYLTRDNIIDEFEIKEDDPILKEFNESVSINWKLIGDDSDEVFWILIDPKKTCLKALDYLFNKDKTFWFAYENDDKEVNVIILWKRDLSRFNENIGE